MLPQRVGKKLDPVRGGVERTEHDPKPPSQPAHAARQASREGQVVDRCAFELANLDSQASRELDQRLQQRRIVHDRLQIVAALVVEHDVEPLDLLLIGYP